MRAAACRKAGPRLAQCEWALLHTCPNAPQDTLPGQFRAPERGSSGTPGEGLPGEAEALGLSRPPGMRWGSGPVSAWTLYSQGRGDNTPCHMVSPRTKRVTEQVRGFQVSTAFDGTLDTHHLCKTQTGKV